MPVYQWKGRTTAKKEISGELEARDRKELASKLRDRKVVLTDANAKPMEIKLPAMAKKITVRDLGIFSRLFSTMVNAGLPIDQCLDILCEQVPNKTFSKVIAEIQYIEGVFDSISGYHRIGREFERCVFLKHAESENIAQCLSSDAVLHTINFNQL